MSVQILQAYKVNTKRLPPAELQIWKAAHSPDCCINHKESSKAMEQEAGEILWSHPISKYIMWYVEMLSDGNSSAHTRQSARSSHMGKMWILVSLTV